MYLVWYILLNIIIFFIFIFPVIFLFLKISFKSQIKSYYYGKPKKSLLFKQLYLEYLYFSNRINFKLFLTNVNLNLNFFNYSNEFNYLILANNNNLNSVKKNLNYSSNLFFFYNFKLQSSHYLKKYKNYLSSSSFKNHYTVKYSKVFNDNVQKKWLTKFSPSNFFKYVNLNSLSNYKILFLRKNKVFNKGRYSRNRQYYRTGVYWCLYVNIIAVVGIYFWFYRFTMNFGYLWWLLYIFILSFIVPKTIKFRLYNIKILLKIYILNFIWIFSIIQNFYKNFLNFFFSNFSFLLKINTSVFFKFNSYYITSLLNSLTLFIKSLAFKNLKYIENIEFNFINSFIKFK